MESSSEGPESFSGASEPSSGTRRSLEAFLRNLGAFLRSPEVAEDYKRAKAHSVEQLIFGINSMDFWESIHVRIGFLGQFMLDWFGTWPIPVGLAGSKLIHVGLINLR